MRIGRLVMACFLAVMLMLALACGGAAAPADTPVPPQPTSPPPATDAPTADTPAVISDDGEAIFTSSGGCSACHTIEGVTAVTEFFVSLGDPLTTLEGFARFEDGTPAEGATTTPSIPRASRSDRRSPSAQTAC